ncbi:hypothetical protein NMY22_g8367 [Coprinellus aureogranulatus]|nr:hypothetical protein NMY22_g8367 [Coprinellus aureogranulatus]
MQVARRLDLSEWVSVTLSRLLSVSISHSLLSSLSPFSISHPFCFSLSLPRCDMMQPYSIRSLPTLCVHTSIPQPGLGSVLPFQFVLHRNSVELTMYKRAKEEARRAGKGELVEEELEGAMNVD